MDGPSLYDTDILAWCEQQAAALRTLGERRDLPNELDVAHLAEEIEALGRSETRAAARFVDLVLEHLIRIVAAPEASALRHWRAEIEAFRRGLRRAYAPSMREKIDIDEAWRHAIQAVEADLARDALPGRTHLPEACPVAITDLLDDGLPLDRLLGRITAAEIRPSDEGIRVDQLNASNDD